MQTGNDQGSQQTGQGKLEERKPGPKGPEREEGGGNGPAQGAHGNHDQEPMAQGEPLSQSNNEQPFSPGKKNSASDQGGDPNH